MLEVYWCIFCVIVHKYDRRNNRGVSVEPYFLFYYLMLNAACTLSCTSTYQALMKLEVTVLLNLLPRQAKQATILQLKYLMHYRTNFQPPIVLLSAQKLPGNFQQNYDKYENE